MGSMPHYTEEQKKNYASQFIEHLKTMKKIDAWKTINGPSKMSLEMWVAKYFPDSPLISPLRNSYKKSVEKNHEMIVIPFEKTRSHQKTEATLVLGDVLDVQNRIILKLTLERVD